MHSGAETQAPYPLLLNWVLLHSALGPLSRARSSCTGAGSCSCSQEPGPFSFPPLFHNVSSFISQRTWKSYCGGKTPFLPARPRTGAADSRIPLSLCEQETALYYKGGERRGGGGGGEGGGGRRWRRGSSKGKKNKTKKKQGIWKSGTFICRQVVSRAVRDHEATLSEVPWQGANLTCAKKGPGPPRFSARAEQGTAWPHRRNTGCSASL